MGAARITLIVFTMASILVLAGFSANEKAYGGLAPNANNGPPPFGDFKCWEFINGIVVPPALLVITDQFGPIENETWEQIAYCTAANKFIGESDFISPFSPALNQHYQGWLYPSPTIGSGTGQTIIIDVPQLQQNFQTTLLNLDSILVPATKFLEFEPFEVDSFDTEQHWNCYLIEEPPLNVPVTLITQHGEQEAQVLDPFLFCAPMIKFDPFLGQSFGSNTIQEHMICYDLQITGGNPFNLPDLLQDQLTADPEGNPIPLSVTLGLEELLCVPAFKSFPTVGGSMIPIDSVALLLAGVQSISMWMIPAVIAGVGISIFVAIRRK